MKTIMKIMFILTVAVSIEPEFKNLSFEKI